MAEKYCDPSGGSDGGTGTIGDPWTASGNVIQYAMDNGLVFNDRLNVKSTGTVSFGGTDLVFTTFGTTDNNSRLIIQGYNTTAGDFGRATVDLGGASTFTGTAVDGVSLSYLDFSGGTGTYQVQLDDYCSIFKCSADGGGVSGGLHIDIFGSITACHVYNLGGIGIGTQSNALFNHVVQSGTSECIQIAGEGSVSWNMIVASNLSVRAIVVSSFDGSTICNNTIYSSVANTNIAIYMSSTSSEGVTIKNNYIEGYSGTNGTPIKTRSGGLAIDISGNRWFNCDLDILNDGINVIEEHNQSIAASGLTDAASGDYTPNNYLIGRGEPQSFLGLTDNLVGVTVGAIRHTGPFTSQEIR